MPEHAIELKDLEYAYSAAKPVLKIDSFHVKTGEKLFLRGPSGSGKSTLLSLIAGIDKPGRGHLKVLDQDFNALTSQQRDQLRGNSMGVIFQQFNLLPFLSVADNILLPTRMNRRTSSKLEGTNDQAQRLMKRLQLPQQELWDEKASALSIGQQQRVAVVRALMGSPQLILADEPTSALDTDNRNAFISLLIEEVSASKATLVFVSHDLSLADHFDRTVDLVHINQAMQGPEMSGLAS